MGQAAKQQQPGAGRQGVQDAILFVSRPSIRPALRQALKTAEIGEVHVPETLDAAVDALVRHEKAMLVLDWELGLETATAVLSAAQGAFNVDTRAIFLIATEISPAVVATGAEFYVARIHSGEISRDAIGDHLDAILAEEADDYGLRAQLTRVADARRRDNWEMAGNLLADLQIKYPNNRRIACELAENRIHEGLWDEAAAATQVLAVTDGGNLRVRHLRARCLMKEGKFDDAAALLQECQLVNPYNVDRLVDLGKALLNAARYREALGSFDEALRIDPDHEEARSGQLQSKLLAGDVNEALRLIRQVSGPRELAALFNNAAILAIRHERFDQGLSLYKTALGALGEKERIAARLVFNLGLAYHKWGKSPEALDCFERACRIDPDFAAARQNANALAARLKKPATTAPATTVLEEALPEEIAEEKFNKT